jgi:transposase-like protein
MTYDEMAVEIMLGPGSKKAKQAKLSKLAKQAKARLENRIECPECGNEGPHEDNGCSGSQKSYLCTACGCCFDEVSS